MEVVRDSIGQIITRDVDPPTFAVLGVPLLQENVKLVKKKILCANLGAFAFCDFVMVT